ncbi:MAG: sortase [bacterium]|nr:sortase [bacterium]
MKKQLFSIKFLIHLIATYKTVFAVTFLVTFSLSFVGLYLVGAVPSEFVVLEKENGAEAKPRAEMPVREEPIRILVPKVGVDSVVENPMSADTATLDRALLKGAVRYPGSGLLGEGNVFIFGHSTSIRVVNNQAYKTFNNLKNLKTGDEILVRSADREYLYRVARVSLVSAEAAWVDFSSKKKRLTLSTCNTFGKKEERYVVEADFVKSYRVSSNT